MKKINFKKFLPVFFITIAILLISCSSPKAATDDSVPALIGTWKASNPKADDGFIITSTTFTYNGGSYSTYSFAGNIVNSPDFTKASGYITIIFTSVGSSTGYTVGDYTVIYWSSFNGSSCYEAAAYNSTDTQNNERTTQSAAESTFTVANGYFTGYGTYTKQ